MYPKIYEIYCFSLEAFCALAGCLLIRKSWSYAYKLLVALTVATFVIEDASLYFLLTTKSMTPRICIYNTWIFVEPFTMIYILYRAAFTPVVKRLDRVLLMFLPVGLVICYILSPGITYRMNEYVNLMCLFAALIAACLALIDILQDMSDRLLFTRPVFWLAAGMLFYTSTFIVIHSIGAFYPYLVGKYYIYFSSVGNTFLYGGFAGCFFALRKKEKAGLR